MVSYVGDRAAARLARVVTVVPSTSPQTVLVESNERNAAFFFNESGQSAYLKFGEGASTASFTVRMRDQSYFELPQPVYWGPVSVVWAVPAGGVFTATETS